MKDNRTNYILRSLIEIVKEIAYDQGTREVSGIKWAQDITDRLYELEIELDTEQEGKP